MKKSEPIKLQMELSDADITTYCVEFIDTMRSVDLSSDEYITKSLLTNDIDAHKNLTYIMCSILYRSLSFSAVKLNWGYSDPQMIYKLAIGVWSEYVDIQAGRITTVSDTSRAHVLGISKTAFNKSWEERWDVGVNILLVYLFQIAMMSRAIAYSDALIRSKTLSNTGVS